MAWTRLDVEAHSVNRLLNLVDDANTALTFLDETVGLNRRAAERIVQYPDGADGQAGTQDHQHFNTIAEMDEVPYVGTSTLNLLRQYALSHSN